MLKTSRGGGKTLSYLLAGVFALATNGAWASVAWIGEGVDEYYGTANNTVSGPSGRGAYFADGAIPHGSSEPLQVSSWTIRFDSYKKIGGASIYVGRACLTDSDKIWTVIADNDDCGFYLDSDYNLEVGWNSSYGDGYFRVMNGKYSVKKVYIGPNVADPETKGVLSIGSVGRSSTLTATDDIEIRNGALTTTNTAVTCGTLTAANKNNSSATVDKTGGDWLVNGDLKMNPADGSTATFYNRDGNLVVANDLYVQDRANGEFYMEGGHVTVSNIVRFGNYNLNQGNIGNLYLNGGVFEAKLFRFHNAYSWQTYGYVVFNGGTYKAMADGSMVTTADCRKGAISMLLVKVGLRGGTIDTAGYDVIFPLQLLKDGSVSGPLTVKGGGSLALSNSNITYNNKIFLEAGTTLAVSNDTAAANILANGIELTGTPEFDKGYTVFVCNKELAESDLDNITCSVAEIAKSIGADGKSIVVTCTGDKDLSAFVPRYIGPDDGSLSDAANWDPAGVPTSGNVYIKSEIAANLTVGETFSPNSITFLPGGAEVTIGGNDLANIEAVTNLSSAVQTFANKVAFKDAYRVYCDGYAVNFAGGATATCPAADMVDNAVSHVLMGDITFTANWAQGDIVNPYTVPNGSVLQGEDARGTGTTSSHCFLSIEPGGKAYFKTAFVSHNKSLINTDGELHVKDVLEVGDSESSGGCHATHDENDIGVIYAGGIHKKSKTQAFIKVPAIYIGKDGLGATEKDWRIVFADNAKTVYATADFEIFSAYTNTNPRSDWGLQLDKQVTFNTQGHIINWTGGAQGPGALVKDGKGVLIFNPPGTALSGAVTVNGGTLKVMSASGVSTGTMTVKNGGTLEVAKGGTLGSSEVTLEAGSTLALTAASSRSEPLIDNTLNLPTEGKAKLRIDGTRLLSGNHVIATLGEGSGAADNVELDSENPGAALDGRKATLRVDGGKLILNIEPNGNLIIIR